MIFYERRVVPDTGQPWFYADTERKKREGGRQRGRGGGGRGRKEKRDGYVLSKTRIETNLTPWMDSPQILRLFPTARDKAT